MELNLTPEQSKILKSYFIYAAHKIHWINESLLYLNLIPNPALVTYHKLQITPKTRDYKETIYRHAYWFKLNTCTCLKVRGRYDYPRQRRPQRDSLQFLAIDLKERRRDQHHVRSAHKHFLAHQGRAAYD